MMMIEFIYQCFKLRGRWPEIIIIVAAIVIIINGNNFSSNTDGNNNTNKDNVDNDRNNIN